MKTFKNIPKIGKKGTVAGLVISFVAIIAVVGFYTLNQYQDNMEEQLAKQEALPKVEEPKLNTEQANANQILTPGLDIPKAAENTLQEQEVKPKVEPEAVVTKVEETVVKSKPVASTKVYFHNDDELKWPVQGTVIMKYNMDKTVYFETLDQYKRNPAMIIDGKVGGEVVAAARGTVKSIEKLTQTGETMVVDMGNGYEAVYGQLNNIKVKEGTVIEKGQVIATLGEPTKYYSIEGCNLYFQLRKDGETVDPLNFLE